MSLGVVPALSSLKDLRIWPLYIAPVTPRQAAKDANVLRSFTRQPRIARAALRGQSPAYTPGGAELSMNLRV